MKNRTVFNRRIATLFERRVRYADAGDTMKASELRELDKAVITSIDKNESDTMRLFYLGMYKGAQIQMIRKAPLHDPYIFYVQGSYLILRRQDAVQIEVELL